MPLAPGTRLSNYEILSLIGTGGMGEVYRARDPQLGRDVAIKVLPVAFNVDPDRLQRFKQESRAAAVLNHPNILTVYEFGTVEGSPYLVTELLDGQTLREVLSRRLPISQVIDYATKLADGLAAAHARGIVHRDLKPENIFITNDGQVKILDFGLAKLAETTTAPELGGQLSTRSVTMPGVVLGTVGYMSPEQVRGQAIDAHGDIFSLGVILYEMLSGGRPFSGATPADTMSAILNAEPPVLGLGSAPIAVALDRLVRRCLEKTPENRFQSAKDLAFALRMAANTEGQGVSKGPTRISARERYAWIVGVACLIGVIAVLLWGHGQQSRSVRPSITLLTTGRTTIAQLLAPEMWAMLARAEPTWDVGVKTTDGSVAVLRGLDQEEGNVGFANSVVAFHAVKTNRLLGHRNDMVTGVAVLFGIPAQVFVNENSSIRRLDDLRGKRVSTGLEASGDHFCSEILLEHYGIDPAQVHRVSIDPSDAAKGLLNGSLDAAIVWRGLPTPDMQGGFEAGRFRLIPLDSDAVGSLHLKNPFLIPFSIPPRLYAHQEEQVPTVQTKMLLVALKSVNPDVIESMLRTFAAHLRDLIAIHPAAAGFLLKTPTVDDGMSIDLHPGAERFYRSLPKS